MMGVDQLSGDGEAGSALAAVFALFSNTLVRWLTKTFRYFRFLDY